MTGGGEERPSSPREVERFVVELLNFVRDQSKVVELRSPTKDDGRPGSRPGSRHIWRDSSRLQGLTGRRTRDCRRRSALFSLVIGQRCRRRVLAVHARTEPYGPAC